MLMPFRGEKNHKASLYFHPILRIIFSFTKVIQKFNDFKDVSKN